MELKPDELPDMVENEVRRVTLNLSGAVGTATINSAEVTSGTLTVGSPSISGSEVSFLVTGSQLGTSYILASAVLNSGETIKGYIRVKVAGQPCVSSADYRDSYSC